MTFRIGQYELSAPVVLAPMAGVTNAPFRTLCRRFAPGLVYVNEMVMATPVVHGNAKTDRMIRFGPDEHPRSLQLYGSDPEVMGRAVYLPPRCGAGRPHRPQLRVPGGQGDQARRRAAVPARPEPPRVVVRAAVTNAALYGVPVTAKFRMGLFDDWLTHTRTGEVCAEEGVAAVALHARTVEQHYSGEARWEAIAELKQAVGTIPVLGNGDIWEATDAVRMMAMTGCDGVVIGRGCLGRPWLFGDLVDALSGRPVRPSRSLGEVIAVMADHARLLAGHLGEAHAMRDFRKHTGWYVSGYPVGPEARRRFSMTSSLAELDDIFADLDPTAEIVSGGERIKRGHTNGPIKVALPDGWIDDHRVMSERLADDVTVPDDAGVLALSGG